MLALTACASGLVMWRADVAGARATRYDREGVLASVRYLGERERAEAEGRAEERTFAAYTAARTKQRAYAELAPRDHAAAVETVVQQRVADRLQHAFSDDFVVAHATAAASFDTAGRAAELLREREVADDSAQQFGFAHDARDERQALLAVVIVLVLGTTAAAIGQVSQDRRYAIAGIAGGVLTLGYCVAVLAGAL